MYKVLDLIDEYKDLVLEAERHIWNNPESGYKEFKTNEYMLNAFDKLGYKNIVKAEGITGFYTVVDTGRPGPTVLILAELDSLINFKHPECDKETGCVHNCGHHAQCATMLGIAGALTKKEILDKLCGKIKLCVVPAEEGIEISYRQGLIEKGVIKYTSGKAEFISRGFFDDVDIAYMVHTAPIKEDKPQVKFKLSYGHNGVIRKRTIVKGKSAHAGGNPHNGINALNVANLILLAINSLRETFQEKHYVRVHSIITKGGDAVNAVPNEVIIESYVRAAEPKAHKMINEKINRTIAACAAAFGAQVHISDFAGSEALNEDLKLRACAAEVLDQLVGKEGYEVSDEWAASSTDMGDMSALYPVIHAYAVGAKGTSHGIDYVVVDPYNACVNSAKFQVGLLMNLLADGGKKAQFIIDNYKPVFASKAEYLAHKDSISMQKDVVIYNEDGTVTLDYKNR